jgi:Holliday junction resolvase
MRVSMNTRQKGRKAENELATIYRKQGYLVDQVKGSSKFNKSVDFFGIADLLCINKKELLIVQVKSNSTAGALKKLREFKNTHNLPDWVKYIVAVRLDNKDVDQRWKYYKI